MREPSAPKNTQAQADQHEMHAPPTTISSTSTVASASGWKARRYSNGPIGMTMSSVSSDLRDHRQACGMQPRARPGRRRPGTARACHGRRDERRATCRARRCADARPRRRSTAAAAPAAASASREACRACSAASVSAPKATNSPCGMKITRVTENTSTSASASKRVDRAVDDAVLRQHQRRSISPYFLRVATGNRRHAMLNRRAVPCAARTAAPVRPRERQSACQLPLAVDDLHHHPRALVEARCGRSGVMLKMPCAPARS